MCNKSSPTLDLTNSIFILEIYLNLKQNDEKEYKQKEQFSHHNVILVTKIVNFLLKYLRYIIKLKISSY